VGAAAVEFALIAPLVILLTFGIVQYGVYFWQLQSAAHAAREGARLAAVGVDSCATFIADVKDRGRDANIQSVTLQFTDPSSPAEAGSTATVKVTFKPYVHGLPLVPFPFNTNNPSQTGISRVESVGSVTATC
jgi:Flp pilus assembly protein TadG